MNGTLVQAYVGGFALGALVACVYYFVGVFLNGGR